MHICLGLNIKENLATNDFPLHPSEFQEIIKVFAIGVVTLLMAGSYS